MLRDGVSVATHKGGVTHTRDVYLKIETIAEYCSVEPDPHPDVLFGIIEEVNQHRAHPLPSYRTLPPGRA